LTLIAGIILLILKEKESGVTESGVRKNEERRRILVKLDICL
jgi:hypothetical protein